MRMWEIRESDKYDHSYRNMRDKTVEEAYECGYEDGYKEAMEDIERGERSYRSSSRSYRSGMRRY